MRHETEIGEGPNAKIVYYSIYMHLSVIDLANPVKGMKVFRKDILGDAGSVYGAPHKLHFEIIASDEQIAKLTGRTATDLDMRNGNGRTDSYWGDMHFYIPPRHTCLG